MEKIISTFIQQVVSSFQLPGTAVSVVKDDRILLATGIGVRELNSQEPVTNQSIFHMASVSKPFVATAVMQLVERANIQLNDPIGMYLPYFRLDDSRAEKITIAHMLAHVSGLPDVIDYQWGNHDNDSQALERYVRSLCHLNLMFFPAERFSYSNIAYDVLGDLISKISGLSFEETIQSQILAPLGMHQSTFLRAAVPPHLAVSPHVNAMTTFVSDLYPYNRAHAPSSTLHSNVLEMSNWTMAILGGGKFRNNQILKPSAFDEMWKPHAQTGITRPLVKEVGLGWFIGEHRGYKALSHSGQDLGFSSFHAILPDQGIGVSILCNTAPAPVEVMTRCILDILHGIETAIPKPPITIPLGKAKLAGGLAEMRKEYRRLLAEAQLDFDFDVTHIFTASAGLLDLNKNSEAIELIQFGLEIAPHDATGFEILARAHFQNGDLRQAALAAQRSLEIEPQNTFLQQQVNALGTQ